MITRRLFGGGVAALVGLVSLGLPRFAVAGVSSEGVSPRLAELADAWEEAGRTYDRVKIEVFEIDPRSSARRFYADANCSELRRWRAAAQGVVDASVPLLREPSRTPADVILKYHVIDMQYGWRPISDDAWIAVGGGALYRGVEREARLFGVGLNPFWRGVKSPFALIDGDRYSPRWAEVARWRYGEARAYTGRMPLAVSKISTRNQE